MRQNGCLRPCQPSDSQGLPTMCLSGARGWGTWDATSVIALLDSCFFRRQHYCVSSTPNGGTRYCRDSML